MVFLVVEWNQNHAQETDYVKLEAKKMTVKKLLKFLRFLGEMVRNQGGQDLTNLRFNIAATWHGSSFHLEGPFRW